MSPEVSIEGEFLRGLRNRDQQTVRSALSRRQPANVVLVELERLGDPAFDAIVGALSSGLPPRQQANGLRALGRICRERADRKHELVEVAVGLAKADDLELRSAAVHWAIAETRLMERLGGQPSLRDRLHPVILDALERSLEPQVEQEARSFLGT